MNVLKYLGNAVNDLKIQGVQPEDISDTEPLFGDGLGLDPWMLLNLSC